MRRGESTRSGTPATSSRRRCRRRAAKAGTKGTRRLTWSGAPSRADAPGTRSSPRPRRERRTSCTAPRRWVSPATTSGYQGAVSDTRSPTRPRRPKRSGMRCRNRSARVMTRAGPAERATTRSPPPYRVPARCRPDVAPTSRPRGRRRREGRAPARARGPLRAGRSTGPTARRGRPAPRPAGPTRPRVGATRPRPPPGPRPRRALPPRRSGPAAAWRRPGKRAVAPPLGRRRRRTRRARPPAWPRASLAEGGDGRRSRVGGAKASRSASRPTLVPRVGDSDSNSPALAHLRGVLLLEFPPVLLRRRSLGSGPMARRLLCAIAD